MFRPLAIAALAVAAILPLAAIGDSAPEVVMATPGSAGLSGGAIDRYTMRFSEAMVPLGDPRAAAPAKMECSVPSTGRWVDPKTYVFEFAKVLPGGLTCKVTLRDGLKSVRGVAAGGTSEFLIDTGGPAARAVLPEEYGDDIEEDQVFLVSTNTPATAQSVSTAGYCAVDGIGEKIPLDVMPASVASKLLSDLGKDDWSSRNFLENSGIPRNLPGAGAERAQALSTIMAVKCRRPLPAGKDVSLVWAAGISSASGKLAGKDQRFDFSVRRGFTARWVCGRVNPQAGCNPVEDASIQFAADVPVAQALAARLTLADGTVLKPVLDSDDRNRAAVGQVNFKAPLLSAGSAKITLPTGLKDESGRLLANAARFPLTVKIDTPPPLVKFAAPFGILEAKEGGILPVTVRAVEPQLAQTVTGVKGDRLRVDASDGEVAAWLRKVDEADDTDIETQEIGEDKTIDIDHTGTKSLLKRQGQSIKMALPGKGKDFEVVGIPLTEPGFYVVELASPALGASLLGRPVTRYVSAAALVTNMAVHFKWGGEKSLAWVTTLDGAASVAGADVRVSDSCTGAQIARGTTDAQGRLIVSGLPQPDTYLSCSGTDHPLIISARKDGDFSFTLTEWDDGIAPYDFDLNFGHSQSNGVIHTVFDRTLIRQGETINMKFIARRPIGDGFAVDGGIKGKLVLAHNGSDTEFSMPLSIGADGIGEASWSAPQGAPMGDYSMRIVRGKDDSLYLDQTFKVDEFRLPTMKASIAGPKETQVRPVQVPLNLFVGFLSGGAASNMPVNVRTAYRRMDTTPDGYDDGWSFGGRGVTEGTIPLNSDNEEPDVPLPNAQTLPATLGADGTARVGIDVGLPVDTETAMMVEMDYQDANGETLTSSRTIPLLPAGVRLGLKTDGWIMKQDDLRLRFVVLDTEGQPVKGKPVSVAVYNREILTARRRLIGGFYAYDNQMRTTKLGASCSATTDALGMATCSLAPDVSGEVTVVAATTDSNGNVARAVKSVWLAGEDDWWFGGDNGDRMDVVPEARSYRSGETAKFQVRMPFREATALVTVEREGVLSSFVTNLSGKNPVVSVPMPANYAPDVYVSVLAVRGRIGGWKLWTAEIARDWGLPFLNKDGYSPTALVDLAKPSYRIGMAKVKVGWDGHKLGVKVKADKARYGVRETAQVDVQVNDPSGKPAKSAEMAFAAVDEALLQLSPNKSWDVLAAMMGERPVSVLTSTAQTQVVGKRHYGRKALEAGGGGGQDLSGLNRENFKPVLLWRGRVPLDAKGRARVPVEMSDSLSAFRLVAVANSGSGWFGTGEAVVRTAQDLSIFSGLPPLVRTGDEFGATVTLRNGTDKAMSVTAKLKATPAIVKAEPQTVTIPAGGAVPVTWSIKAPDAAGAVTWEVEAKGGKATDRMTFVQDVVPAVPVEVWAATLTRVGANTSVPLLAPAGALPGYGFVDVKLSDTLAPPLAGVRAYMGDYPYDCVEQQTSRFVVAGDQAGWDALASKLPAYTDRDGLLRYWPIQTMDGDEALTAYILSVTQEAGYAIPDESREKLLGAMKAVVEGRLKRNRPWQKEMKAVRVSALAALARHGKSTPAMLGSIGLAPADMATSTLAEWMVAIDRTKGANKLLRDEAEKVLRQRLVYEGSRLDLVDAANAPWWMMVSGDEMAIKSLLAILGRPGWSEDESKMMVGVALRQQRGHWDTTTANAWGVLAARRFATLYPATAINGPTMVSLGNETKSLTWPVSNPEPLRLSLPMVQTPLMLNHANGAGPWAAVSLSAAVPLKDPLFAGYRVTRDVKALQQAVAGKWTRGDVIKVRITVEANAERNWVVVSDPVPPGATILGDLGGQSQILAGQAQAGNGGRFGYTDGDGKDWTVQYGVTPAYVERGRDAWRGYFDWVPRGKFVTEYAVRLNGSGRFSMPPTRVEAMYSPDIRGQLPNAQMVVEAK